VILSLYVCKIVKIAKFSNVLFHMFCLNHICTTSMHFCLSGVGNGSRTVLTCHRPLHSAWVNRFLRALVSAMEKEFPNIIWQTVLGFLLGRYADDGYVRKGLINSFPMVLNILLYLNRARQNIEKTAADRRGEHLGRSKHCLCI
jgi:hypothetical protein